MLKQLPILRNPMIAMAAALVFVLLCLGLEAVAQMKFGEIEWGLVVLATTKVFDFVNRVMDLYDAEKGD